MSKYKPLWDFIRDKKEESLLLSYHDIQVVLGFPLDHSFLTYKKELNEYGYQIKKISMKQQTVLIEKIK